MEVIEAGGTEGSKVVRQASTSSMADDKVRYSTPSFGSYTDTRCRVPGKRWPRTSKYDEITTGANVTRQATGVFIYRSSLQSTWYVLFLFLSAFSAFPLLLVSCVDVFCILLACRFAD